MNSEELNSIWIPLNEQLIKFTTKRVGVKLRNSINSKRDCPGGQSQR